MNDKNITNNFSEEDKLEWIKTYEKMSEMDKGSGMWEKMTAKIKQNPLVPIGMIATVTALSFGLHAMKSGNKQRSQKMMRARIYAQGFTIAAILGGIFVASKTKVAKSDQKD